MVEVFGVPVVHRPWRAERPDLDTLGDHLVVGVDVRGVMPVESITKGHALVVLVGAIDAEPRDRVCDLRRVLRIAVDEQDIALVELADEVLVAAPGR